MSSPKITRMLGFADVLAAGGGALVAAGLAGAGVCAGALMDGKIKAANAASATTVAPAA
jgi:hypothetical protein